jgi:hypothetical protein
VSFKLRSSGVWPLVVWYMTEEPASQIFRQEVMSTLQTQGSGSFRRLVGLPIYQMHVVTSQKTAMLVTSCLLTLEMLKTNTIILQVGSVCVKCVITGSTAKKVQELQVFGYRMLRKILEPPSHNMRMPNLETLYSRTFCNVKYCS